MRSSLQKQGLWFMGGDKTAWIVYQCHGGSGGVLGQSRLTHHLRTGWIQDQKALGSLPRASLLPMICRIRRVSSCMEECRFPHFTLLQGGGIVPGKSTLSLKVAPEEGNEVLTTSKGVRPLGKKRE